MTDEALAPPPAGRDAHPHDLRIDESSRHQCGRCRAWFACDDGGAPRAVAEWWLCDPCRAQLLNLAPAGPARP